MNKTVRWGVLSTALIAQEHLLPAFTKANNAEVVAIASSNKKVEEIAAKFSIPKVYGSYEDLLDDVHVDAVYIPLPNGLHLEWVIKAAEKGKHVLCEKPASLTANESKKMMEVCRKNGVIFMEAFMYQFHPQHQRVKQILASGEIGELKIMRSIFSFYLQNLENNIRMKPELGGGSLYDVGCYCIHSIRNILDSEPTRIHCEAQFDSQSQVDMSVTGIMELKNGMIAVFDAAMDRAVQHQYEIVGTKGRITVPRAYMPQMYNGEGIIRVSSEVGEREETVTGDQYMLQVEHFSQCVLEGGTPMYTVENTIQNMAVMEECFKSIELTRDKVSS